MTAGEEKKELSKDDTEADLRSQLETQGQDEFLKQMAELMRTKRQMEVELTTTRDSLTKREQENQTLRKENESMKIDSVTGLENHRSHFISLFDQVEQILNAPATQDLLARDSFDRADFIKLRNLPLSVMIGDIGYLNKYNEDPKIGLGHEGGNMILRETGAVIKGLRPADQAKGYRYAGDEFSMIIRQPYLSAEDMVRELQLKHSEIEIPGSDLPPMINTGVAHVSEAILAFMKLHPLAERKEMDTRAAAERISDLLTKIADLRAERAKREVRIFQMISLFRESPDLLARNMKWIYKGSGGLPVRQFEMSQEETEKLQKFYLDELAGVADGQKLNQLVNEFIDLSAEIDLDKDIERFREEKSVLREIAGRPFYLANS